MEKIARTSGNTLDKMMTQSLNTKAISDANTQLKSLKANIDNATKASGSNSADTARQIADMSSAIGDLSVQLDQFQNASKGISDNLSAVNDLHAQMAVDTETLKSNF